MYFKKFLQQDYSKLSDNDNIRLLIEHLTYSSSQEKKYNAYQQSEYLDTNDKFFSYLFSKIFTKKKHSYKLRKILAYISSRASIASFNNFHLEKLKFLQFIYHLIHKKSYFQMDLLYQNKQSTMSSYYFIYEIVRKLHQNIVPGKVIYKYSELHWYTHILKYSSKLHLPIKEYLFQQNGNEFFSDFPIYLFKLHQSNQKINKEEMVLSLIDYLLKHHQTLQCPLYSTNHNLMFQLILNKDKVSLNLGIQLLKNFTEEDYFCNIEDSVEIMCNLDIILCYGKVDYLEYLLNQRRELFSKEKIEKYCQFNPISSILFNSSLTLNEKKKFILQLPQQVHIVDKSGQNFLFYYVNYLMMSYSREFGKAEKTFFNWLKHKFKIDLDEENPITHMNLFMFALKRCQYGEQFSFVKKQVLEFLLFEQKIAIKSNSQSFHPLHYLAKIPFKEELANTSNGLAYEFLNNVLTYFKSIGVEPNISTIRGNNALHFALISKAHYQLVDMLLNLGVNINQKNSYNKSAFDYYQNYSINKRKILLSDEAKEFEQTHNKIMTYYEQHLFNQQFLLEQEDGDTKSGGSKKTKI